MQEERNKGGRPQKPAREVATRTNGDGEELARFSAEVPPGLLRRFDAAAKRDGRSRVAQVRKLIEEYLSLEKS